MRRWRVILLAFEFAVVASALPRPISAQALPDVYVDEGACPFECCQYGPWWADRGAVIRSEPADTAPVIGTVQPGDTVQALTGQVRTVPTPFVWKQDVEGSGGHRYAAGDTLYVLTYLGEGFFRVWHEGEVFVESLDFSPYGGTSGKRCERCTHGELLHELRSEWWVQVRLRDGTVGWTDATDAFLGKDACG
ncbi:MAG TPA: hypothetical protein VF188_16015 [Longimicrobiales bacterium]